MIATTIVAFALTLGPVFLPLIPSTPDRPPPAILSSGWPTTGIGVPFQGHADPAALGAGMDYWWYNWLADPNLSRDPRYVPMVWRSVRQGLEMLNDGRPLLVLNEPEIAAQANLSPDQAAAVIHQVASFWRGNMFCGGTLAHSLAYTDALIDAYQARYGAWPCAGWHVHVYANRALHAPDIASPAYVSPALADLAAFIAHQRARGVLGRGVVVSEYGALTDCGTPDMAAALVGYTDGLRRMPGVLTSAWFAAYYAPYPASNLLRADGQLTALGHTWRSASAEGQ